MRYEISAVKSTLRYAFRKRGKKTCDHILPRYKSIRLHKGKKPPGIINDMNIPIKSTTKTATMNLFQKKSAHIHRLGL